MDYCNFPDYRSQPYGYFNQSLNPPNPYQNGYGQHNPQNTHTGYYSNGRNYQNFTANNYHQEAPHHRNEVYQQRREYQHQYNSNQFHQNNGYQNQNGGRELVQSNLRYLNSRTDYHRESFYKDGYLHHRERYINGVESYGHRNGFQAPEMQHARESFHQSLMGGFQNGGYGNDGSFLNGREEFEGLNHCSTPYPTPFPEHADYVYNPKEARARKAYRESRRSKLSTVYQPTHVPGLPVEQMSSKGYPHPMDIRKPTYDLNPSHSEYDFPAISGINNNHIGLSLPSPAPASMHHAPPPLNVPPPAPTVHDGNYSGLQSQYPRWYPPYNGLNRIPETHHELQDYKTGTQNVHINSVETQNHMNELPNSLRPVELSNTCPPGNFGPIQPPTNTPSIPPMPPVPRIITRRSRKHKNQPKKSEKEIEIKIEKKEEILHRIKEEPVKSQDSLPLPAFQFAFGSTEIGRFSEAFVNPARLTAEQQSIIDSSLDMVSDQLLSPFPDDSFNGCESYFSEGSALQLQVDACVNLQGTQESMATSPISHWPGFGREIKIENIY